MEQLFAGGGALQVPFGADFFSVAVGVLTGAIFACDRKLDIVGTIVLGLVTAYGGGIIRDLLLQDHGVYFMEYPEVILICICLAVFVFYFRGLFRHTGQVLFFADALSVALFALAGANKAFACGEGFVMVVILGALTSVGGGALRDISVGETPGVFQRSNFYAVAGFGGAFVFAAMAFAKAPLVLAAAACWGLENNCTRNISDKSTFEIVFLKGIFSGLGSFLIALCIGEPFPGLHTAAAALLLGFVAYGLSIFCYVRSQNTLGAAKTSAYYAIAPFIGTALSCIIWHDALTVQYFLALAVMLLGSVLVVLDTLQMEHTHSHTHTFTHTHDGVTHTHTITHSHPHFHGMHGESHQHRHTMHTLLRSHNSLQHR